MLDPSTAAELTPEQAAKVVVSNLSCLVALCPPGTAVAVLDHIVANRDRYAEIYETIDRMRAEAEGHGALAAQSTPAHA